MYGTGLKWQFIIWGVLWGLNMFIQIGYHIWQWIDDVKKHKAWWSLFGWEHRDLTGEFWAIHWVVGLFFAGMAICVWPLTWPAITIYGLMLGARSTRRFTKKINKAIGE
jgi:hypothetical protein